MKILRKTQARIFEQQVQFFHSVMTFEKHKATAGLHFNFLDSITLAQIKAETEALGCILAQKIN